MNAKQQHSITAVAQTTEQWPATVTLPAPTTSVLLTPEQLAEKLAVPPSWIREKTRERARIRDSDPLPVVRLGRYVRFRLTDVEAWLARQTTGRSSAGPRA
jgi:excisionase family DNA binding protein